MASLVFYGMWRWEFCFLIVFSGVVNYVCAKEIFRARTDVRRKSWLGICLILNLGLLGFFKYTFFFIDNIGFVSEAFGLGHFSSKDLGLSIILPLGISFYTFQCISYLVDVYRKTIRPASSFIDFFAYVIFWPQLIAGPILRAGEVLPQLQSQRLLSWHFIANGISLIVLGLFKKSVLADKIAPYVDFWFEFETSKLTALDVWNAAVLFGFQIYFDFSGYSDIAIGSACLLGLTFPKNFHWPYMSISPKEFWGRWHISLSSWVRDYLYLPLIRQKTHTQSTGGIHVASDNLEQEKRSTALLITWILMGFWHGASWNFIFWGLYHSIIILLFRIVAPVRRVITRFSILGWLIMFPLTMASWIFFRASTFDQALAMYSKIVNPYEYKISPMIIGLSNPMAGWAYLWGLLLVCGMLLSYFIYEFIGKNKISNWSLEVIKIFFLGIITFFVILFMQKSNQFVYFQF